MATLAIKVDIDTFRGMQEGVPRILKALDAHAVSASFFVSFGPDRSGLAVLQLLRPKFLKKMIRTNAPSMYGLKTALYGTLLPAPLIGMGFPDTVREIAACGHEVACHAWDHRLWQDWLPLMSQKAISNWFEKMVAAFVTITGRRPAGFGAPGWRMDRRALEAASRHGFTYFSCSRAQQPFVYEENALLEIPSNLPCIEEVGITGVLTALEKNAGSPVVQVLPIHAEVEGGSYAEAFGQILVRARSCGYTFKKCIDAAGTIDLATTECRALRQGMIPGRAFACTV